MKALIIEDNEEIAECMEASLADLAITADRFAEGRRLFDATRVSEYDLVILDLNLPDHDGLKLLKKLRDAGDRTPVLIVSARINLSDKVSGLDIGADDYLTKPFELEEFEARVRALLRRQQSARTPLLRFRGLAYDQNSREFSVRGAVLDLSPRERSVLEALIRQGGAVINKERIFEHVFNFDDDAGLPAIELYIHRLRKKLERSDVTILTKRGMGYALGPKPDKGRR